MIVNDGSKDDTAKIADEYAAKYPTIVKAIHKENGGHGSAVNTGIENATGIYFKVVDSDDWVKEDAYLAILEKLRELTGGVDTLDLLISNFVYEKEGERRKKVMRYKHVLPEYRMFGWEDVGRFHVGQYILMHSVIYRTKLLRECGLKLPEHTFYVDNIYVFEPLPYVRNMYYLDVNFYRYFIGRSDQSVNEKVMTGRIDQQIKVNQIMTTMNVQSSHDLVDLDLLIDSSRHDLFVDGLIGPADKIAVEIHIQIVHVADIRQRLKDINIVHIKRMLRKL